MSAMSHPRTGKPRPVGIPRSFIPDGLQPLLTMMGEPSTLSALVTIVCLGNLV